MAITAINPNAGAVGTDFEIVGTGFSNATGVRVGTTPIPMVVVSDTLIRASIPPGATTGNITVLDPDGDQISPDLFTVRSTTTTPPEETPRGREALDVLILAGAYKGRNDAVGVAGVFVRSGVVSQNQDGFQTLTYPTGPSVTPAAIEGYQQNLLGLFPANFTLDKMLILGTVVEVYGHSAAGAPGTVRFLLRQGSGGFQIANMRLPI